MTRDLNDDLSDLLGGETAPATSMKQPPASYVPFEKTAFVEGCPKCRGTGSFISYSGRNLGPCFACKGAGKNTYSTSPEARAKSRERALAKRVEKAQEVIDSANSFRATYPDMVAWLEGSAKRNAARGGSFTFPADLLEKLNQYGSLTDAQFASVCKLMARDAERAAERTAAAPAADVSALEKAFDVARERAKLPGAKGVFTKPLKLTHGEKDAAISVAISSPKPGSKWDGMLFVRDAKDDERKLGYFKGGKFFRQGAATDAEAAAILAVAASPLDAVKAYAKAWSECGICGRMLLKAESIEAGIGPICASKYGWGL
jgi:hypothetical protein